MTVTVSVGLDPLDMSTEDLQRAAVAFNAELTRREEVGDSPWRTRYFRLLLDQLGDSPQGRALREAAHNDGYVSRDRVMRLLGRDPARRLTGFRKPITKAVATLARLEPGFPSTETGPLYVDYSGGVTARGFYVDPADLVALRAALNDE